MKLDSIWLEGYFRPPDVEEDSSRELIYKPSMERFNLSSFFSFSIEPRQRKLGYKIVKVEKEVLGKKAQIPKKVMETENYFHVVGYLAKWRFQQPVVFFETTSFLTAKILLESIYEVVDRPYRLPVKKNQKSRKPKKKNLEELKQIEDDSEN